MMKLPKSIAFARWTLLGAHRSGVIDDGLIGRCDDGVEVRILQGRSRRALQDSPSSLGIVGGLNDNLFRDYPGKSGSLASVGFNLFE
jgi:hypothetical protein